MKKIRSVEEFDSLYLNSPTIEEIVDKHMSEIFCKLSEFLNTETKDIEPVKRYVKNGALDKPTNIVQVKYSDGEWWIQCNGRKDLASKWAGTEAYNRYIWYRNHNYGLENTLPPYWQTIDTRGWPCPQH